MEVEALSFVKPVTTSMVFPRLVEREKCKREARDALVMRSTQQLAALAEDMEAAVLRACFELKQALEQIDEACVLDDKEDLRSAWDDLDVLLGRRSRAIDEFGRRLEQLEQDRATRASQELRCLVDDERLVERQAMELNAVVISNRRSHGELLALLRKRDVDQGEQAIQRWRDLQDKWRRRRHAKALAEFQCELESLGYKNPVERSEIFGMVKQHQDQTNLRRGQLVHGLCRDSTIVQRIKDEFKEVYDEEDRQITDCERKLTDLAERKRQQAIERRERLRFELHHYGALAPEPDLEDAASIIEQTLQENDAFFRAAGGLKPELKETVRELRDPLVYNVKVQNAKARLRVALCGVDIQVQLERQGKTQQLNAMRDTLERLRQASRQEVIPLLQPLQVQTNDLAKVANLDQVLVNQLDKCASDLHTLTKDLDMRFSSRASCRSSNSGRQSVRSSVRSTTSEGPEVNMLEVRTIQKRLAMLVRVCDLDGECVLAMRRALSGLDQKQVCNDLIDTAIEETCTPLVDTRLREYQDLRRHTLLYLEHHVAAAYDQACRVCDFFAAAALAVETKGRQDKDMDEKMLDDLFDVKETFVLENKDSEQQISNALFKLRHAAAGSELDEHFATVLELLEQVEAQYRKYHADATAKALEHPKLAAEAEEDFKACIDGLFFLDRTVDDVVDHDLLHPPPFEEAADLVLLAPEEEDDASEYELTAAEQVYWLPGFRPLSDDDVAALDDKTKYLDDRAAHFRRYDEPPDDEHARLESEIDAYLAQRDAQRAEAAVQKAMEAAETTTVPVDAVSEKCVREVVVDRTAVLDMVTKLKESTLEHVEKTGEKRRKRIDKLTTTRLQRLTEELEERLRTHWPRKGRSEVSFRQPREGELIMHRQRKQRHVRLVEERDRGHTMECRKRLVAGLKQLATFQSAVADLESQLPSQSSLAGLQGVESRYKKTVATFQSDAEQLLKDITDQYAAHEPQRLYALNDAMLKATRLFDGGGDYSKQEAQELRDRLDALKGAVQESVAERLAAVEGLRDKQTTALDEVATRFNEKRQDCQRDLALREGLGTTFGAPKRTVQERLRAEQSCDEERADDLDRLLSTLERQRDQGDEASNIVACLQNIQHSAVQRAAYLACFAEASPRITECETTTLADAVKDIEEKCRQETKDLYEQQGAAERLEDARDSLDKWLVEASRRVLGDTASYRDRAARRLRTQVQRLEGLIGGAAVAVAELGFAAEAALVASRAAGEESREGDFAKALHATSASLVRVLDGLLVPDDLAALPGDEFVVEKKRKSLKRLRKARRFAEANPDQGDHPRRDWPGLSDVSAFTEDPVELDALRAPHNGFVTPAHRALIKARDAALAHYLLLLRQQGASSS